MSEPLDLDAIEALERANTCGCIVDPRDECCCDADGRVVAVCREIRKLREENARLDGGFDRRCADFLADEVAVLIKRRVIDERSPAADALLDYRNPPRTERSDRLDALAKRVEELEDLLAPWGLLVAQRVERLTLGGVDREHNREENRAMDRVRAEAVEIAERRRKP